MNVKTGRLVCGMLISGAALAGTAVAATPEEGSVSKSAPKFEWTGETTGGYLTRMPTAVSGSEETPCEAPSCDQFALKVADSANLTIAQMLDSESETAGLTLRIIKPDGSVVQEDANSGAAAGKYFKVVIKNAPTGDYTVQHYNNAADTMSYSSYAELAVPAAPAPAPAAPVTSPPPPAPVEAINLAVATGKASAKKLAKSRSLPVKVTVSREVKSITATLKKGSKTVGKGSLGVTSGTKTLKVKIAKKLKKGTYSLSVLATDGSSSAGKTIKVKVAK
jgi:hypothetical protein